MAIAAGNVLEGIVTGIPAFGVKDPLSADEALRRPDLVTSSVEGAPAVVGPPASIEDAEAAAIALY